MKRCKAADSSLVAQEENRYRDGTKNALTSAQKGTWTMGRPEKIRLGR